MKVKKKTHDAIKMTGGALILILLATALYFIWCPEGHGETILKLIMTEGILLFIIWILDGVLESDNLEL